jgi:CheY-like chemotaxis protein
VLRPAASLWDQLAKRIASETDTRLFVPPTETPLKPEWEEAAPGIHVKILARNTENDRVTMLVRLDPGADYPGHRHADIEELHLLHGILNSIPAISSITRRTVSIIVCGVKPAAPVFLWPRPKTRPGLILLDIRLPDMNGVDVARAIKKDQRTAHIPIVGWSAYFGELWREEALRAGMVAYMEKPLSAPVIEATIKKFILPN